MKAFFESRYYGPPDNETAPDFSRSFRKPQKVRRCFGERWLARNFELIEAVAQTGNGLVDLWEASPIRLDFGEPKTDQIIDLLFPGNPLLCCAWSRHRFETRARQNWYKLQDLEFIVPNPMNAKQGATRKGNLSARAVSNTGPRRFLIVEFDFEASNSEEEARLLEQLVKEEGDVKDLCAALVLHLAERAPLALAVHSGGKSLHGWFYCAEAPEETVWRTFQYAVSLGADPANWTRSQFARMPDGLRENASRQTAYFLNPELVK